MNCGKDTKCCIKCGVENCVYHTEGNICDAGNIEVGPSRASDCSDTECKTFTAK